MALIDLLASIGDLGGTTEVVPFPSGMHEQIVDCFQTAKAYLP